MTISRNIRNIRRSLITLAIVFPLFYLVFVFAAIVQDYRATINDAASDVRNMSVAINEHAIRAIGETDSALRSAIAEIEREALTTSGSDDVAIHEVLKRYTQKLPQSVTLNVVDAHGQVRVNGLTFPMQAIDVRDRDYFRHHSESFDPGVFISRTAKSRANGKWAFALSRRISNPDGSLKMLVVVGMALDYFDGFYRSLHIDGDSRVTIVRTDGRVLVESPFTDRSAEKDIAGGALLEHFNDAPAGNFLAEKTDTDDVSRIYGYAGSTQYPILASASVSTDSVLAAWRERTMQSAAIGAMSIVMMLALIAVLWRRMDDLVRAQSDLKRQNDSLGKSERRFQDLVDGIDGIVWEANLPDLRFTYVSGNAAALSGYSADTWLSNAKFWHEKLSATPESDPEAIILASRGTASVLSPVEHHIIAPDGREICLRSNIRIVSAENEATRLRGVMVDITSQKISENQLFQLAHFDQLTRLPNRQSLTDRVNHAIAIAGRNDARLAVMFVDVDHFKNINDSLGHEVGDQVLREVAARISHALRESDTVARIGGDDFVVLLEDIDRCADSIDAIAEKLAAAVAGTIHIDGRELYVTLSMGISVFPQDGRDSEILLRNADTAMYRAKVAGRNCWAFFDESMAHQATRRMEIESALRHAIERNELMLHYQPQRSLTSNCTTGVEALLRWSRPGLGLIPPLEFIPLAEESGLIIPIGNWVLQTACEQGARWLDDAGMQFRISVNIAAKQIHHKGFVEQIRSTLETTGLPPAFLELEITESSILENIDETVDKLRQIKALGVTIAIDDFGTGYSSLSYVKQLPIDRLKIDRSFVKDTPTDADDCTIVRTIIALSRNLGLSVIAEGVETQAQIDFLSAEGCDAIQGYILSKPISAEMLHDLYHEKILA